MDPGDIISTYSVHGKTFASKDEAIAYKIKIDRQKKAVEHLIACIKGTGNHDGRRTLLPKTIVEFCSDNHVAMQQVLFILVGKEWT